MLLNKDILDHDHGYPILTLATKWRLVHSAEEATLVWQTIHLRHIAPKPQIFRLGVLRSFEHQTPVSYPSLLMYLLI